MADTSTIAFRVDTELHRKLKAYIANNGISLSEYFIPKIEADLNREEQGISSQQTVREELRECVSALSEHIQRMTSMVVLGSRYYMFYSIRLGFRKTYIFNYSKKTKKRYLVQHFRLN